MICISTNKTNCHDIAEILKVTLNTINQALLFQDFHGNLAWSNMKKKNMLAVVSFIFVGVTVRGLNDSEIFIDILIRGFDFCITSFVAYTFHCALTFTVFWYQGKLWKLNNNEFTSSNLDCMHIICFSLLIFVF